jgi:general secretion pathway protein K
MNPPKRQPGFALIIVLWVGLLIAAIAGAFVVDTRLSAQLARNFVDNAQARALADGGVHIAMSRLLEPEKGSEWRRDGRIYQLPVPGGVLNIAVEDEAGKINLNTASTALLEKLFRSAGLAGQEVELLLDGIEESRRGSNEPGSNLLARINLVSRSPKTFFPVDSFAHLPGLSEAQFSLLHDRVTVHGSVANVNYLNASREVLLAIPGVSPEAVDAFLGTRDGGDQKAALDHFVSHGDARKFWNRKQGQYVTVKVLAVMENGARFGRAAVIKLGRRSTSPFLIREWREESIAEAAPSPDTETGSAQ